MQGKVYRYTGEWTDPLSLWRSLNLLGDAWWFGWSETAMYLPRRLNGNIPESDWEQLSIFNGEAELRITQHGKEQVILLLTEAAAVPSESWRLCGEYECVDELEQENARKPLMHVLLGDPPKRKKNSESHETTTLFDVAYPAHFDYGIPLPLADDESKNRNFHRVVAYVRRYYDSAYRLRYVRYAGIDSHSW